MQTVTEYKAPCCKPAPDFRRSVFLAGAIDMGRAVHWQTYVVQRLIVGGHDVDVFNPRRDDWDSSWVQSIDNAQFKEQVEWELRHLLSSYVVMVFFPKDSQAPISLLELGLLLGNDARVVVCCEPGYWRRGNIEVLCDFMNVPLHDNLDEALVDLESILRA